MSGRAWLFLLFVLPACSAGAGDGAPVAPPNATMPPRGRLLVHGRAIDDLQVRDRTWIRYRVPRPDVAAPLSEAYDLAMVSFDSGEQRTLLENVSVRWGTFGMGSLEYAIVDETAVVGGGPTPTVGTLVRFSVAEGVRDRTPSVAAFTLGEGNQLLYWTPAGGSLLDLRYRRGPEQGTDRVLGPASRDAYFHKKSVYFVAGEDRTLSRVALPDGPVQPIRSGVVRSLINEEDGWSALEVATAAGRQTVLRHLATGAEQALPVEAAPIWLGLSARVFRYSEAARGGRPAMIHELDLETSTDRVTVAPPGLVDVVSVWTQASGILVYTDSTRQVAVARPGDEANAHLIVGSFGFTPTPDGRNFLYIKSDGSDVPRGPLFLQDLEFRAPPRLLSPPGALAGMFFSLGDDRRTLAFTAATSPASFSDLYYSNLDTGESRVVAERISTLTVNPRGLFGVVRTSPQTSAGDLVMKDLTLDTETVLAHEVVTVTRFGNRVAYTIREAIPSERDGLWVTDLDPAAP